MKSIAGLKSSGRRGIRKQPRPLQIAESSGPWRGSRVNRRVRKHGFAGGFSMIRSVVLAMATVLALAASIRGDGPGRPNVIVFLADDLGHGDLGCYGHPRIRTPSLDAFARQGVRLTQCYSASA